MIVHRHASGAALLLHAGSFLEHAEAENALILGVCATYSESRDAVWMTVDDGGPLAVAIRTPPYHLALTRTTDAALDALVDALADDDLPGVTAPSDAALAFGERWARARHQEPTVTMRQGIYALRRVVPPVPAAPGGKLRAAGPEDATRLAEWIEGFASDAVLPAERPALRKRTDALIASRTIFLWDDDAGDAVSMAALTGETPHGIRVSMVYTPPERRGRGHASACVAALSAQALASGRRFCMLYTDLANATSNALYQRIGYEWVCESTMIAFTAPPP